MPVKFSAAAYRFGHSQVRPGYLLGVKDGAPRIALLFPVQPGAPDPEPQGPIVGDLRGGRAISATHVIAWEHFFGPDAQPSKLIDERISSSLLNLL